MIQNILTKIAFKVNKDIDDRNIASFIYGIFNEVEQIYSYIIKTDFKNNEFTGWEIQFNISQRDSINTINTRDAAIDIAKTIIENKRDTDKYVIGYKQPSIDVMIETYSPFIKKLALKHTHRWPELEFDDAYQLCMIAMIKLYNAKYYLHKNAIIKACNNEILMYLRKHKDEPTIVSIDEPFCKENDKDLYYEDIIEDTSYTEEREKQEHLDFIKRVFADVKELLIKKIGERQFEQLFNDYAKKHTDDWSRKKMCDIKKYFNKLGITIHSFDKYL